VTDADRVGAAFAALEAGGIVTRTNFTCCQNCGYTEIRHETVSLETGRLVVAAVRTAGLTADRDGTLDRRIAVPSLEWRRLPR
jgi:Domain of unknown function (DUF6891)